MSSRTTALANMMKLKKEQGQKYILMLGAGASLASGMPFTSTMKQDLLDRFGGGLPGATVDEKFDRLWEGMTPTNRDNLLQIYFHNLEPSPGYLKLADLIRQGYFDIILTLNFDTVLEAALDQAGVTDKMVIVCGDQTDEAVCRMMEKTTPRVKFLKLHGSAKGADTFLFTKEEMLDYPDEIRALVGGLTKRDIIICGYGFEDMCMLRAFSLSGQSIFCVNPSGAPPNLKPVMNRRQSVDNVIDKDDGRFDNFFQALWQELAGGDKGEVKPIVNPFKFMEGYKVTDSDWFVLRRKLTRDLVRRLETTSPPALHLWGPPRSGKTSFVRAGLMAGLQKSQTPFWPVYVRCRANLETWLAEELAPHLKEGLCGTALEDVLQALARASDRRVILILDQFERVVRSFPESQAGRDQLKQCIRRLIQATPKGMTVVCVGLSSDTNYLIALNQLGLMGELIDAFEGKHVRRIILTLARKAGIRFDREAIDRIVQKYADSQRGRKPFTLTHVQALCHLLCSAGHVDVAAVERAEREELNSLDLVLSEYDLFGLMEDVPFESQQVVLRQLTKFMPEPGRQRLASCLKDRFAEIFPQDVKVKAAGANGQTK